jgi:hypothetical protein
MIKTIQNLIDKFGADKLHQMIDEQVEFQKEQDKIQKIFATRESATEWFEQFCKDNNFTFVDTYDQTIEQQEPDYNKYGKSCLALNGWRSNGPYVYLWLNKNSQPHFEMGSSIYDIWSYFGYSDAINKIKKIVKLREEA